jgi:hypothetical protein
VRIRSSVGGMGGAVCVFIAFESSSINSSCESFFVERWVCFCFVRLFFAYED